MKGNLELIKKLGSGIIVFLLVIMLAITFTRQPIDEVIDLITGKSNIGKFNGITISKKDYGLIQGECESQFQQYGLTEIPPQFINSCVFERIQSLYVKPVIADELGLGISRQSIESQIVENIKIYYETQKKKKLPGDIIPPEELYNRELAYMPIHKRIAYTKAYQMESFITKPIPISKIEKELLKNLSNNDFILQGKILVFSNKSLMDKIKVEIQEEEIRTRYEEEKKQFFSREENKNKEFSSYEEKRLFLKESIENDKKRSELSRIKENLNKQKFESIEDLVIIENITGNFFKDIQISILQLHNFSIENMKLNLNQSEVLKNLLYSKNFIGPISSGESTIYLVVNQIKKLPKKVENNPSYESTERLTYVFYDYLLKKTRERGKFELNIPYKN